MKYRWIYEAMYDRKLVDNRADFCERWLGRNPAYLATVDSRGERLSLDAASTLRYKLIHAGQHDLAAQIDAVLLREHA